MSPVPAQRHDPSPTDAELMSALIDGELDDEAADRLMARVCGDLPLREGWSAHLLVGDALRSHDVAALDSPSLRRRIGVALQAEPTVLAPQSMPRARWRRWGPPVAAVAAAGAMLALGLPAVLTPAGVPLQARDAGPGGVVEASLAQGAVPTAVALDADEAPKRDPRLERYLRLHREFGGSAVMPRAAGYLRNAEDTP